MEISELCGLLMPAARVAALGKCFKDKKIKRIKLDGLVGSAPSVVFSQLPRLKQPYLAVANDMDEAGYLYNDLCQILGEQAALLFPSGYKRDIKYGQEDAPSQILRAEVLSRWDDPQLRVVVTYPEALAEKVAMRQQLIDSTLSFRRGGTADLTITFTSRGSLPCVAPSLIFFHSPMSSPTVSTFLATTSKAFARSI